jgi:hypothetical protein
MHTRFWIENLEIINSQGNLSADENLMNLRVARYVWTEYSL